MGITIEEFIEQMRQGMDLMRDACEHIPWEQCPNCPFYLQCDMAGKRPMNWEEK